MSADRREHLQNLLAEYDNAADLLRGICDLCVTEVAVSGARARVLGATSVNGGGALVYSSDELGVRLDDLAVTVGLAPCFDAFELGRPVLVPYLTSDSGRWPGFTADAVTAGAAALFSFPLQVGGVRLGVLEMHRRSAGPLTQAQLTDALLLADAATDTIFDDVHGVALLTLSGLVDIHAEVHQATGMVAVDMRVSLAEALLRIRGHAFAHHRTLTEVAKEIIERRLRLDDGE
ncbi:GAF and ANTAR domain-containing protein [Actinophytocola gossypii]|uniref:GAF and ANTAR domain-containing protein n=1 Tax=Actinophytocola gossypii TaxID=2812003 RepID=A0ABT2JJ85_9PSEU|nr:GAF and ANTAR domain-containing protein [Actinophytocola gossypii]MCT2587948.1 GAF and ANTAR domain-containing protein [Actinophytocola gossypii]